MGTYYAAGHTYQIVKTAMTWSAARTWAESQGGHLAYITSASENQALITMTQLATGLDAAPTATDGGGARYLWLGGSDADMEGTWRWGDGSLVSSGYSNWGAGALGAEPDNFGGVQDALAFGLQSWPQPSGGIGTAYKWNDVNPSNSLYFVVEWDYIRGTTGADTISRSGGETVYGLEGNDVISYASGYNYLRGDAGDDTTSCSATPASTSSTATWAMTRSTAEPATTGCAAARATTPCRRAPAMTGCGATRAATPSAVVRGRTCSTVWPAPASTGSQTSTPPKATA